MKNYSIALLTIGSEILDGRVQDTNSNFLCRELQNSGYFVNTIISCDDQLSEIIRAVKFALENNSVLIATGGLGPTTDDLTREAIAGFLGDELILNAEALEHIKSIYSKRARNFEVSNEKQALFPSSSSIINNSVGIAPGFSVLKKINEITKLIVCLPGVPGELKKMLNEEVLPILKKHFPTQSKTHALAFKTFGLPESVVGARIKALNLTDDVVVSYRAHFPEIHVILKSSNTIENEYQSACDAVGREYIFSYDLSKSFEQSLQDILIEKRLTISSAESCSGGMAAAMLTNCAGSSQCYLGSMITYANQAKSNLLDIPQEVIEKHGAVSREAAALMAKNCRTKFSSDFALSITGVAGPDGGSPLKPVGIFYIGFATKEALSTHQYFLASSRHRVRQFAAYTALDLLRRHLLGFQPQPDSALP